MFDLVKSLRKWFDLLIGPPSVGGTTASQWWRRGRALHEKQEVTDEYKEYVASEGLDKMGEAGSTPISSVSESFFSPDNEELVDPRDRLL